MEHHPGHAHNRRDEARRCSARDCHCAALQVAPGNRQALIELIVEDMTDAGGVLVFRGFKGDYEIKASHGDASKIQQARISAQPVGRRVEME